MSASMLKYREKLGISKFEFMALGDNLDDSREGCSLTVVGLNMCNNRNAVSKKHREVATQIARHVLPSVNGTKAVIDHVTNGVHLPTWISDELAETLMSTLGEQWSLIQDDTALWGFVKEIDNQKLWNISKNSKVSMVNFIRERVRIKYANDGIDPIVAMAEGVLLDPDILTIGFARRMAEYKRPDLILADMQRLEKILGNNEKPVQIVFAGKAHPADMTGKKILQRIFKIAEDPKLRSRIAFVEDYGENVAKYLLHGVDVWLNNPLIPMEACGTSGMKASLNGTLHLSVLDGWWPEGFNGKNGWAFGVEPSDDIRDANALYDLIENEIVPLYYDVDNKGVPNRWIEKMKEAMSTIAPGFSARRMMKDYLQKFYIPISKELQKDKKIIKGDD